MNKTAKIIFGIFAALILLTGSFAGGFLTRHVLAQSDMFPGFSDSPHPDISGLPFVPPTSSPEQNSSTPEEVQETFAPFWEVWNIIHAQYVEQPVDDVKLMEGAIKGMLDTLDIGVNYYSNAEQQKERIDTLNGKEYEGIGAYVDTTKDYLTVIAPIKDSPAAKAGLRSGDMIIAIDGNDMTGTSPEDARLKVLGPGGTEVILTILREGEAAPFDVSIIRAKIIIPLVEHEMLPDNIAYVRLNSFGDSADRELRKALDELLAQNPKGLILDLRNNGGGWLTEGIAVTSEFIPADTIVVIEKFGDGTIEENLSTGEGIALDIPMVVLVNEATASASEIVAGALQDYGRAKLVGVTTYGKGSVQNVNTLSNDGAVAITSAQWLTPYERFIEEVGLDPDVYVTMTQEDVDADRDPQLDAAIQTLLAIIGNLPIPTSQPNLTPVAPHP